MGRKRRSSSKSHFCANSTTVLDGKQSTFFHDGGGKEVLDKVGGVDAIKAFLTPFFLLSLCHETEASDVSRTGSEENKLKKEYFLVYMKRRKCFLSLAHLK